MELIADILLVAGAIGAGFYCFVLSRRLARLNDLENGVGGAVAVLSAQVDDLGKSLKTAQTMAAESRENLSHVTARAEEVAAKLELMLAALHDVQNDTDVAAQSPENIEFAPVFSRRAAE
ncbi:hypothetical protein NBRC116601_22180 [Cognatishimia sp. WU-CL00825]|uniref:hypothetical protein n=1 Tax=Cognatishimia sp. WU-CL00825 TaxID=3127658 RepID=UPI0031071EEA